MINITSTSTELNSSSSIDSTRSSTSLTISTPTTRNTITANNTSNSNNTINPIDSINTSDSSDSPTIDGNSSINSSNHSTTHHLDISCIDLTVGDDDIEIITEKLSRRPLKKRKRDKSSCSAQRTGRNSSRETSLPLNLSRVPTTTSPPTPSARSNNCSPQPRSDSSIVDLANSPSPSTSTSSNKNNVIDVLVESVPNKKNIAENQGQEKVCFKVVKCPICLEEDNKILAAGGEIVVTICGHVYCKSCIQQAIKTNRQCPKCRKKLTQRNFHRIFL